MQSVGRPSHEKAQHRARAARCCRQRTKILRGALLGGCLAVALSLAMAACSGRDANQPLPEPTPSPSPPVKPATSLVKPAREALALLKRWVLRGASDPTNGWAMAHGLLAFGRDLKASDGRLAIDVLVKDFLSVHEERGRTVYFFAKQTPSGEPLATHRHLVLKAMLEAGVPLDRSFELRDGGSVTLKQIAASAKESLHLPGNDAEWHDFAWSMGAMLDLPPDLAPQDLATWCRKTLSYTEKEQAFINELMQRNRPDLLKKERQGIYSHNCGGLHLVQSAIASATRVGEQDRAAQQLAIVLFRFTAEKTLYEGLIADHPDLETRLRVQELKFYGHTLETLALANAHGAFPAGDRAKIDPIAAELIATIHKLETAYRAAESLRLSQRQLYLDLIGDGCHAIRGLDKSLAAGLIP